MPFIFLFLFRPFKILRNYKFFFWLYLKFLHKLFNIFNKFDAGNGWLVSINPFGGVGELRVLFGNGVNSINAQRGSNLNDDQWHYIAIVFDYGDNIIVYIDGAQVGASIPNTLTGTISNPTKIFGISTDNAINGIIDNVRIYNRALTAQEIQQHYNNR